MYNTNASGRIFMHLNLSLSGPIAGSLEKVISIRAIVTWGVFIASLSCILCYWAYDVTLFVLLVGGLYGVGTGLTCTLTPVLLNERFPPEQRTLVSTSSLLTNRIWVWMISTFLIYLWTITRWWTLRISKWGRALRKKCSIICWRNPMNHLPSFIAFGSTFCFYLYKERKIQLY